MKVQVKKDFSFLAGDDPLALGFNAQGGIGCISVAANIVPGICARVQNLWAEGNIKEAMYLQELLTPLYNCLFCETNPVPVKYAASLMGLCDPDVRLPLVPLTEKNKKLVKEEIASLEKKMKAYEHITEEYSSPKP